VGHRTSNGRDEPQTVELGTIGTTAKVNGGEIRTQQPRHSGTEKKKVRDWGTIDGKAKLRLAYSAFVRSRSLSLVTPR